MPRAKAAPKRDAQALVQVSERPAGEEDLSDDEWVPPSTKAPAGGGGGAAAAAARKKPKQAEGKGESGGGGGGGARDGDDDEQEEGEGKKQQQKKKEKSQTTTTYKDTTTTFDFDHESIAAEYVAAADGGGGGTAQLGLAMHNQLLASARVEAANRGGQVGGEYHVYGSTPGKRTMVTSTFKFNGKTYKDKVPLYEREEVVAVFAAVLRRYSTKRRKATAAHPSVKVEEVAKRSPPLFWSLFWRCPALQVVLTDAEALMAGGEEEG